MAQSISFTDPYAVKSLEIERRRRIAEQLRQDATKPMDVPQPVGGVAVRASPLAGIAKLLQGYTAGQQLTQADEEQKRLVTEAQTARQSDTDAMVRALRGQEAIPAASDEVGGGPGRPAMPGDPNAAASVALGSQFGDIRSMAPGLMNIAETRQNRADEREFKRDERIARAAERMLELQARLTDARLTAQDRMTLQRELATMQDETRRLIASGQQALTAQTIGLRRDALTAGNKPPSGYRWTPDGQLEAIPGGPGDKADKPVNETQGKAALYGTRAAQSDKVLKELEEKISTTGLAIKQSAANTPVVGGILGAAGNVMLSKEQQRVEQAQRDFVNAVLRQESGAVISDAEFANAQKQYFPAPGDSKDVIEQKRTNRKIAIEGFKRMAGPAAPDVQAVIDAPLIPGTIKDKPTPERRSGDRRTPPGVDPAVWAVMTPEERALWKRP